MRTSRFVGVDCGAAFSQSKVTAGGGLQGFPYIPDKMV